MTTPNRIPVLRLAPADLGPARPALVDIDVRRVAAAGDRNPRCRDEKQSEQPPHRRILRISASGDVRRNLVTNPAVGPLHPVAG